MLFGQWANCRLLAIQDVDYKRGLFAPSLGSFRGKGRGLLPPIFVFSLIVEFVFQISLKPKDGGKYPNIIALAYLGITTFDVNILDRVPCQPAVAS